MDRPDEDMLSQLEGMSVRTSQGSYVRVDEVRRLMKKRQEKAEIEEKAEPAPKTLYQAREQAKRFLQEQGIGKAPPDAGRSLPASDPNTHPVSRPLSESGKS